LGFLNFVIWGSFTLLSWIVMFTLSFEKCDYKMLYASGLIGICNFSNKRNLKTSLVCLFE